MGSAKRHSVGIDIFHTIVVSDRKTDSPLQVTEEARANADARVPLVTETHTDTGGGLPPALGLQPGTTSNVVVGIGVGTLPLLEVPASNYEFIAEHGRGGIGIVRRARDRRLDRIVAIKEMQRVNFESIVRFEREMRTTAKLQHPGIVPVHEAGHWPDGSPFYSMRLVEGRSFKELMLEANSLPERLALVPRIFAVAETIAYAHDQLIIHRDLKPSNIMVGRFGETVVIDWGLAKDLRHTDLKSDQNAPPEAVSGSHELTSAGAVIGTPAYMAPEQASGAAVDERADVYAIGAILYHLLSGALPYTASSSPELLAKVTAGEHSSLVDRVPGVPVELATIVDKAMSREPGQRYPNAAALAEDLRRFQAGQLVGAHRYTMRGLFARWARRNRNIIAVSVAALAALLIFGVVSIQRIVVERSRAQQAFKVADTARRDSEAKNDDLIQSNARNRLPFDPTDTLHWLAKLSASARATESSRMLALTARAAGVSHATAHVSDRNVETLLALRNGMTVSAQNADFVILWDAALKEIARYKVDTVHSLLSGGTNPYGFVFTADERHVSRVSLDSGGKPVRTTIDCQRPISSFAFNSEGDTLYCLGKEGVLAAISVPSMEMVELAQSSDLASPTSELVVLRASELGAPALVITTVAHRAFIVPLSQPMRWKEVARVAVIGAIRWRDRHVLLSTDGSIHDLNGFQLHRPQAAADATFSVARVSSDGLSGAIAFSSGEVFLCDEEKWRRFKLPMVPSSMAIFSERHLLAFGAEDGRIIVLESQTGSWKELRGHTGRVRSIAFSSDGRDVFSGGDDGSIRSWAVPALGEIVGKPHSVAIFLLDASRSVLVAFGVDKTILLKSRASDDWVKLQLPSPVAKYAWNPVRPLLATAAWDGLIRVWDVTNGLEPALSVVAQHEGYALGVAWDATGTWLASAGADGLLVFTSFDGQPERVNHAHSARIDDVLFDHSIGRFISAGRDNRLCASSPVDDASICIDLPDRPVSLAELRDRGVIIRTKDGRLLVWDGKAREAQLFYAHPGKFTDVSVTPDGMGLAALDSTGAVIMLDREANLLTSARPCTARALGTLAESHPSVVVVGCDNGEVWLSDYRSQAAAMLHLPGGEINALAMPQDEAALLTSGSDGTVRRFAMDALHWYPDGTEIISVP